MKDVIGGYAMRRRSPRGSVDWNISLTLHKLYLQVAPLVGAWIEISKILYLFLSKWSLPSWERGLKSSMWYYHSYNSRRSPRGSVDWNTFILTSFVKWFSRSPRGSVDWNIEQEISAKNLLVAPLVGAWIEIHTHHPLFTTQSGRSPRGSVDWNKC